MLTKLEKKRQAIHILLGAILCSIVYYFYSLSKILIPFAAIASIVLSFASKKHRIPLFSWILDKLERKTEKERMHAKGLVFYLIGSSASVLLFTKDIALASIAILAIGDSISRLAGPYGYLKHPFNSKKFIEGVIAGFICATIAASAFVRIHEAATASAISMFLESLDIEINNKKLDDNLSIPVVSSITIILLRRLSGLI